VFNLNQSRISRLRGLISELGTVSAILYVIDRLMRRFSSQSGFYYYLFVAQPLADQPRLPPARGRAYTFHLLQKHEPVLDSLDRSSVVIRQRFSEGSQCLLATRNNALVGCIWFARDLYAEDEVDVDYLLPKDGSCVWDFDVYVTESERLGFLFAKQWDAFDSLLRPEGVRYTLSRINAFNQRSVASHRSLGAHGCGRALFLRLGAMQLMVSSQRPFVAFGGRPSLHISAKTASQPR
jgi:hypothetical protein